MLLREFISNQYSADLKGEKKYNVRVELNFTWGKKRTAAQETVPQGALRDCSKEAGGGLYIHVILVKWRVHVVKHTFL